MSIGIVFIVTGLHTGGAETMLLKLLRRLDRDEFSPVVISLTSGGEIQSLIEDLDIPVYSLGGGGFISASIMIFKIIGLLKRYNPDIVHTWMYHADFLGGLSARLFGCRRVIWGLRQSNLSKQHNKFSTLMIVSACARLSGWLPAAILSCSHQAESAHIRVGYDKSKIHVIPNGFELDRFRVDLGAAGRIRAELSLAQYVPLVGLVARYDSQKNHPGFIEAAALVHSAMPDVHFVLAGKGVNEDNYELMAVIESHGLSECTHLLGQRDDIPRLMASFTVLVSSSHGEAFPNVLGEAMACGIPCVVTDAGDSAEIVADTGRVVTVGDMPALAKELLAVLGLPLTERQELGARARARIASLYEIGRVTKQYQEFYRSVLSGFGDKR